ncbi:hypothetical protein RF11_06137 [Thelohanellus kitauei]|uniref:Uncharacterized protein n=1 Tax=Thelohanellus kitauei TaxID=669202 RepID=A0A0C2MKK5_THEKT|nr:hypothetical protein RF11_06137 [Thelohanellus kitauei]
MRKQEWRIFFVIFEILALGCCSIMIYACFNPTLFQVVVKSCCHISSIGVGPFLWYYDGQTRGFENVTDAFRFIQVMYGVSLTAVVVSQILTIRGYMKKGNMKVSGYATTGAAVFLAIFSLAYTLQFILWTVNKTFIFTRLPLSGFVADGNLFTLPFLLILVWPMTIAMFCLGGVIMIHKFNDDIYEQFGMMRIE